MIEGAFRWVSGNRVIRASLAAAILSAASLGCVRSFAADASAHSNQASANQKAETSLLQSQIEIVGSDRFSNQVHAALLLLKSKAPDAYSIITNYIGRIQQGAHSGMWAYKSPPTYEMADPTTFYSLTWCAATIAHDSFHSKLYHDYQSAHHRPVPDATWTGTDAERQCMKHQLAVMEQIGAPQLEVKHAQNQADGHYVKNNETWRDYTNRVW
jgi:hypothetical protein